ncbi:serine/threonine-protein phosphatase 1 regulatory subunit 10-like [Choloepus didactylus]|uniref:serine/threonine-protein phosphatase 1 regulatory subunit 10-like n=1 Tax=Choloepus didactylus TaxID=27675 RepID=UPI00189F28EE|nr:serine/threonine-protein phosphatase 1 regulatory subunit 10-like [Choloepus didactylus]
MTAETLTEKGYIEAGKETEKQQRKAKTRIGTDKRTPWDVRRRRGGSGLRSQGLSQPTELRRRAGIPPPPGPAQDGGPASAGQLAPSPAPGALPATRAGLETPIPPPPERGVAGRAGGPLPAAMQDGRGRGALTVSGADRSDWGPEEEEKEEEEKEEHENTTRRRRLPLRNRQLSRGKEGIGGWGVVVVNSTRCLMGRLRVTLRASGFPFFPPTRKGGAGMCADCGRGPGPAVGAGAGAGTGTGLHVRPARAGIRNPCCTPKLTSWNPLLHLGGSMRLIVANGI